MDPALFKTVIVPLLGVDNTAVMAISSPDDELNYYSQLLDQKDQDGNPIFAKLQIGLSCEECMDAQKSDCPHKLRLLPRWKPVERQKKVEAILANDKAMSLRETHGMSIGSAQYCFEKVFIKKLRERKLYQFKQRVNVLHMAIDPSGGGKGSDYAVCTMAVENQQHVVSHPNRMINIVI